MKIRYNFCPQGAPLLVGKIAMGARKELWFGNRERGNWELCREKGVRVKERF